MIMEIEEVVKVVERLLEGKLQEGRELWLCGSLTAHCSSSGPRAAPGAGRALSGCLLAC